MAAESVDDPNSCCPYKREHIWSDIWKAYNCSYCQILNTDEFKAYYTRECARKVLEERLDEVKHISKDNQYRMYISGFPTEHVEGKALNSRIAELRAAIREVGGGE